MKEWTEIAQSNALPRWTPAAVKRPPMSVVRAGVAMNAAVLAIGIITLAGKLFQAPAMTTLGVGGKPLAAMVAIVAVIAAISEARVILSMDTEALHRFRRMFALVVTIVASATIFEYAVRGQWGIARHHYRIGDAVVVSPLAGSIAPATAVMLLVFGVASLTRTSRRFRDWSCKLETVLVGASWLIIIGYLFDATWFKGVGSAMHVAFAAAVIFFLLPVARLYSYPNDALGPLLASHRNHGFLTRRLLLTTLLVPLVLGFIQIWGYEQRYFDARTGTALLTAITAILLAGVSIFIARRMRDVEELAERNLDTVRWASAIVDSTHDAVISKDLEGEIFSWNTAAEQIYGYERAEMIGTNIRRIIPPDRENEFAWILEEIRAGRRVDLLETERVRRDGTRVAVGLTISPVHNKNGEIVGASAIGRELSEIRRTQAEAEKAKRLVSIGRLAAQIAHELNNVLMGIQPFAELLQKRLKDDAESQRFLGFITRAVKRGRNITHGVLKYSRKAEPKLRPVDVQKWGSDLVAEMWALVPAGVRIDFDTRATGFFDIDPDQMSQVLTNLVLNAADAMGKEGSLALRITQTGEDGLEIVVTDTGSGIEADNLEHLFEPLFTTKSTGTGLGLAVSHQIVSAHGGTIAIDSRLHHGTAVTIRLPHSRSKADQAAITPHARPTGRGGSAVVLVVDDEETVLEGLVATLELEGYVARRATNGAEALRESQRGVDAILLDVRLGAEDGREIHGQIRRAGVHAPIIFSTAHARTEDLGDFDDSPILLKPYSADDLYEALDKVLRAPAGR